MKKKYRLVIIILFVLFMTGCKANYNIKVYLDGQVDETIMIQLKKEEIIEENYDKDFSKEKIEKRIKGALESAGIIDKVNKYSIDYNSEFVNIKIDISYNSIEEYVNNSEAIHYLFSDLAVETSVGKTKLLSVNVEFFENNKLSYKDSIISINLPYKVSNTNATLHDEDNNTYTWVVDEYFEGIEIEYSKSKLYSDNILRILPYAKPTTYFNLAIFVVVTSLLILIVYLVIKLFVKEKHD